MGTRLYVGNVPFKATEQELRAAFAPYAIDEVRLMTDPQSGRPRGFAFVELTHAGEARDAIERVNGVELLGRKLVVNAAHEKGSKQRQPRERYEGGGRGRRDRGDRRRSEGREY